MTQSKGARVRRLLAAGAASLIASGPLLLTTAQPAAASPTTVRVMLKDFAFVAPDGSATVTVNAGDRVQWTYDEVSSDPAGCEAPQFQLDPTNTVRCPGHSTTAIDNGPDGKPLWNSGVHRALANDPQSDFPYVVTFDRPGTYKYYCTVHGGSNPNNPITHMDGTVVVKAASTTSSVSSNPPLVSSPSAPGSGSNVTVGLPNAGARSWRDVDRSSLILAVMALPVLLLVLVATPRALTRLTLRR